MRHNWNYKTIGDVCTSVTDGSHNPPKGIDNSDYRMISSQNIFDDNLILTDDSVRYLSKENHIIEDKRTRLQKDVVLLTIVGTIGRACILTGNEGPLTLQRSVAALHPSEEILPRFLLHTLIGNRTTLNQEAHGIAQKGLYLKQLSALRIPVPTIEEQQKIVSELDKINELIRLKKEQLKDYDNLAQSIFYEMFGDPVVNEKGWDVKKLGEEYKVSSSKRIMQDEWTTEGVPFLKVSDVVSKINGQNSEPSTFISETTYSKLVDSNAVPVQNDILITSRGTLGLCYIVKNEDRFYFQDGMITWLAECKGNITPLFLTYLFKNHHFLQQITSKANKSTVAYISISQISKREIPLPPLALQNLFAQRIELIEQQKAEIKSTIADLETLLASRMQYWFFGF